MNGFELAEQLGGMRPGLRVLFISGYADPPLGGPEGPARSAHVLSKPFGRDALIRRVRQVLDAPAPV